MAKGKVVIASRVFLPETRFSFSRRFSARRVSCWNHGRRNCAWPGSERFRAAARFLRYPPPVIGKFRLRSRRRHLIGWSGNFSRQQETSGRDKWTLWMRIMTAGYWFYANRKYSSRLALWFISTLAFWCVWFSRRASYETWFQILTIGISN